jgi:hypothetical protein
MRYLNLLCASLLICFCSFSQTPGARWSRPIGGTGEDFGTDIKPTLDGGFLFIGTTHSNDADVSGNHGENILR